MIYDWFKIFNLAEFLETGLSSRTLTVDLIGVGRVSIQISRGNEVSITYADHFLPLNFLTNNPYADGDYAVYVDDNDDVHLGILTE